MSRITIIPWQPAKSLREENEDFFSNSKPVESTPMGLTEQMKRVNTPHTTIILSNEIEEDECNEEN